MIRRDEEMLKITMINDPKELFEKKSVDCKTKCTKRGAFTFANYTVIKVRIFCLLKLSFYFVGML